MLERCLRRCGAVLVALLTVCASLPAGESRAGRVDPPNILFVYLDDFGWRDAGFMGSDFYETPHLDRLAGEGMVFSAAYACAANCAPSRACLLSGQYTPRHGIFNVGTRPRGNAKHRRLEHVPGTTTLDPDIVTWAELLQANGYRTGMFGKWHLGTTPEQQGFDVAVQHNALPGFRGHLGPDGQYLADVLTDRAIEFIRENREGPWCAYLAHFAVHTPLQPKPELLGKYTAKEPGDLHDHVVMATMIQAVDDGVGRILAALEELDLDERTVIVFSSDNGGFGPATDMAPLKGYKGTYYEGGIRVPFFVRWPGVVEAGGESHVPISGIDVFPTLCEIAGFEVPADKTLDGLSLVPLLKGDAEPFEDRALFWHFPAYLQSYSVIDEQRDPLFRTRPCSVIRVGRWKLHQYFEDSGLELYDLADDITESENVAVRHPEKVASLLGRLTAWQEATGAPVPTEPNPEFDAAAESAAIERALRRR